MRLLLDSGIANDFINRRRGIYERAQAEVSQGNPIGVVVPVLAELVAGIEGSTSRDRNMKSLLLALRSWRIWPFDAPAAFEYGRIQAELLRIGRPMQIIDIMIAAIAQSLGNCKVITTDSDLLAVPGLKAERW